MLLGTHLRPKLIYLSPGRRMPERLVPTLLYSKASHGFMPCAFSNTTSSALRMPNWELPKGTRSAAHINLMRHRASKGNHRFANALYARACPLSKNPMPCSQLRTLNATNTKKHYMHLKLLNARQTLQPQRVDSSGAPNRTTPLKTYP